MEFDFNNILLYSDDEIIEKVNPLMDEIFNQYYFLNIKDAQRKEIIRKLVINARSVGKGNIDYIKKVLVAYIDGYIKNYLFDKMKTIALLNRYLNSLPSVNNYEDAIDNLDKLKIFMDKYEYILNKDMFNKLLRYSGKFLKISNLCIENKDCIDSNNYLFNLIIEAYYAKLNSEMVNDDGIDLGSAHKLYIDEIIKIPLLNDEKEVKLFQDYHNGDMSARDKIVEANLRLVVSIANNYVGRGVTFNDLVQEGNMGLVVAVEHYRFDKDCKFSTYAYYWIKQYIYRTIKRNGRRIRIPEHYISRICKYRKAKSVLDNKLGRNSTVEEMAEYLKIPLNEAIMLDNLQSTQYESSSINALVEEDGDEIGAFIASEDDKPEDIVIARDMKERVRELIDNSRLTEQEKKVIRARYGLNGEVKTLDELGKEYGLTRSRIHQVEKNALNKMRRLSKNAAYRTYIIDEDERKSNLK